MQKISIGDYVATDGTRRVIVTATVYLDSSTFYLVKLCDIDVKVELDPDWLTVFPQTNQLRGAGSFPVSVRRIEKSSQSRLTISTDDETDYFIVKQTIKNTNKHISEFNVHGSPLK